MTRLPSFALLGLLLTTVAASAQTPEPVAPAPAATLRVMSFNIRNSGMKDGENHWKFRQELWTATVRAFDPDLLGTQEVLAEGGPVVVSGDFNCTEDDAAYAAFTHPAAEGRLAFADSFRAVHPTREKDEASFHGLKGTTAGSRIDWILSTPQFQARAAEIIHPAGGRYPSDHYPVTAVLEWQK